MKAKAHTRKRNKRSDADRQPLTGNQFQTFNCQASLIKSALSQAFDTPSFREEYLLTSLLSKLGSDAVPEEQRAAAAIKGWYADEEHNRKTDLRLRKYWEFQAQDYRIHSIPIGVLLNEAASIIRDTLPKWDHSFYEHSVFTNGSAVGYRKAKGDPWYKYDGKVTVTPLAYSRVYALISATAVWHQHLALRYGSRANALQIVNGEKGFTIQKNAETDRYCSQQPTGNMLLQKAQGQVIRQALRAVGINLNDQSVNRNAARRASITKKDATIDLKSASNSVICMLVMILLPPEWVRELMAARSPVCTPSDGMDPVRTYMIGAMGNGFTFELESLIFWALAEACRRVSRTRGRVLVFGDDVIAPVKCIHLVMALYGYCGFRINKSKSFWDGDFRESCGGHYKNGVDVTPIYIRKPITDTSRMIWFCNKLRAWAGTESGGICDEAVWPLYKRLRRKFVCPTLWGGVRSSSVTSLWGPGPQRRRLALPVTQRRITGRPALLRTFQYMSPSTEHLRTRFAKFHGDIQAYYEVFGSIPLTSSMERLTTVVDVPDSTESNLEMFADPLSLWADEVPVLVK